MCKIFRLVLCEMAADLRERKIWVIAGLIFVFSLQYTDPVFTYSREISYPLTPWLFPFALYGTSFRMMIYGCAILLFSNIYSQRTVYRYEMMRVGERRFLIGNIVKICIEAGLYMLYTFMILILPHLSQIYYSNDWGGFLVRWSQAQQTAAAGGGLTVCMRYFYYLTPWQAVLYTAFTVWISVMIVGLIIYYCQIIGKKTVGIVIAVIMLCVDLMIQYDSLGGMDTCKWVWISPLSWSNLSNFCLDAGDQLAFRHPPVMYGISAGVLVLCAILVVYFVTRKIFGKLGKTGEGLHLC